MPLKFKRCKLQALLVLVILFLSTKIYASAFDSKEITNLVSGNSLRIINKFSESIIYFESDGSFTHLAKQGAKSNGKWRATKDSMCATVLPQPYNPPKEFCLYLKGRKYGETWVEPSANNGELKRTLLKGHPKL